MSVVGCWGGGGGGRCETPAGNHLDTRQLVYGGCVRYSAYITLNYIEVLCSVIARLLDRMKVNCIRQDVVTTLGLAAHNGVDRQ